MNRMLPSALPFLLVVTSLGFPTGAKSASASRDSSQGETAKAQELLPFGDLFTAEEMSRDFAPHQFTPLGESKLSFEILVPKGWESHLSEVDPGQLAHDTQTPVPMAEFAPSGADDVGIQVLYMRVPGQAALDVLLGEYVKKAGGTLLARQRLESKGRTFEDALMRTNDDTLGPLLNRVSTLRRGEIVYFFTGWGVEEKYEKYKRAFGAVLASLNPTGI